MTSKDTWCAQQVNDFVATLLNKRYQDRNATELNMLPITVCSSCCFGFHSLHPQCLKQHLKQNSQNVYLAQGQVGDYAKGIPNFH
jgi:hypothetical protein